METGIKLEELATQHRIVKKAILDLMGKAESKTVTKERIKEELFKLYIQIK